MTIDLQPVKGTRDFYPEDMRVRQWLFARWREVARAFGFEEYDACVLEHEELYIRKAGDEITGQLYGFADKSQRRVALRPEMTPSLARMVLAKGASLPLPARWFAIPQCFRYENMQRGRKREHFQWNMDIIGLSSVAAEAELMAAQCAFLRACGLRLDGDKPDIVLKVSNRQVIQHFLEGLGIGADAFPAVCVVIDKRDKIGADGTTAELTKLGLSAEAAARIIAVLDISGLDAVADAVGKDNPGVIALTELMALCASSGIADVVRIDLSVIRGLSYYTGTVWEVFDASGSLPRAIAGGGRYDRLMELFGGTPVPMVGFGFGDVVITEILAERGLLPKEASERSVDDVVYPMSAKEFAVANRIALRLRAEGRSVVVDYSERRFKHVVKRAEDDGARRLFILGGNEVTAGVVTVRTMGAERSEEKLPLAQFGA
ncbi:MAG: histidine--tRNA ligase [Planctomycetes bacterium]|nr:histidine--tRNA ligase [Planctomycetota bacterium]